MNIYKNILILTIVIVTAGYFISCTMRPKYNQAEKIAKWQSIYKSMLYSFDAVAKHNNGYIYPAEKGTFTINDFEKEVLPYLSYDKWNPVNTQYKYRKMNGKPMSYDYQFKFDDFLHAQNGVIYSFKENAEYKGTDEKPRYYMFIDINGEDKPNVIGKDIFFISIYRERIRALGYGENRGQLKTNCSALGSGIYCSEHYLLGGKF